MRANEPFSRRHFLASATATTAGILAAGNLLHAADPTKDNKGEADFPKGRYVDVHTHLGPVMNGFGAVSPADLLRWMDTYQVAQAVVLPLVSPEAASFLLTNEFVLEQTKPHRDRLIPFCCLDPRTTFSGKSEKAIRDMLGRWIEQGAKGFGEHKPGIPVDDPRNLLLYGACGELSLPVLFHLDQQRNMDKPGLPGLENALRQFPKTTFIGHGPGWWASISGDVTQEQLGKYPVTAIKPGGAIDTLMEKYPNLYGDLSAGSGNSALRRDMKFAKEFVLRRADRLLFGTDYLRPDQEIGQFMTLRLLELPADVEAKVCRDNARRVLFGRTS